MGIIASGLSDGSLLIIDPNELVNHSETNYENDNKLVLSNFELYEN